MLIWTLFAVLGSVVAGLTGYVTWRDRRRSPVDRIIMHTAMPAAYRHGERHPDQYAP